MKHGSPGFGTNRWGLFTPPRSMLFRSAVKNSFLTGRETRVSDAPYPLRLGYWNPVYYGMPAELWTGPRNYSGARFVERWVNQDPLPSGSEGGFPDSALLEIGMDQESVVRLLGSPLQRIELGGRETWKYTAYSLVFEAGRLVKIR